MTKIQMRSHGIYVGMRRMKARVKKTFWRPGWWKDAEDFVRRCGEYEIMERTQKPISPSSLSIKLLRNSWDLVSIYFKGLLNKGSHKFLLVVVDYYSRCPEMVGMTSTRSGVYLKH